jgi:hypothetical protein
MYDEFLKTFRELVKEDGIDYQQLSHKLGYEGKYIAYRMDELNKTGRIFAGFLEEIADYFGAGLVYTQGKYYLVKNAGPRKQFKEWVEIKPRKRRKRVTE